MYKYCKYIVFDVENPQVKDIPSVWACFPLNYGQDVVCGFELTDQIKLCTNKHPDESQNFLRSGGIEKEQGRNLTCEKGVD